MKEEEQVHPVQKSKKRGPRIISMRSCSHDRIGEDGKRVKIIPIKKINDMKKKGDKKRKMMKIQMIMNQYMVRRGRGQ